jgi:Zn-finger nucleic acid-binding protein
MVNFMTILRKIVQLSILCGILLSVYGGVAAQKRLAHATPATKDAEPSKLNEGSFRVQLTLKDGTAISADEAWESEQGIWYQRGGMNHLLMREQVKGIVRGSDEKLKSSHPIERVATNSDDAINSNSTIVREQPVWIHLVGGARVEADSVVESAAGVWYRRGPLAVFVERVRIDHIERETLETLAESESSTKKARGWTTGNQKIDGFIRQSGARYGVDPYLIFCVMEQESQFNPRALSPKGARGLMQLMPGTSARLGVARPSDPAQNIAGGTRYLKLLLQQFKGRIDLVLASYNAGEGAVMKFGWRVPPYRETREYVKRISYRYHGAKPATSGKSQPTAVAGAGL